MSLRRATVTGAFRLRANPAAGANCRAGNSAHGVRSSTPPSEFQICNFISMAPDPRVQHLLRRAGFGATSAEAAAFSQRGFTANLDALIDFSNTPDDVDALIGQAGYSAVTPSAGGMEPFSPASVINDARQRWLFRMVHSKRPLQEKMALFWHQHFATAYSKIANAVGGAGATQMMAAKASEHPAGLRGQIELFRDYALPNFRDLLFEVARDPAMLFWLDGRFNTKVRPQENFSREVMELFTIGVGQFTESDVYAGARVFTGWNLRRIGEARDPLGFFEFFFNGAQHDTNAKTFTFPIYPDGSKTIPARPESSGMQDGLDLIAALARHPATGRRLAQKLWSFFVSEIRPPDAGFVDRIAALYARSDCHMAPVVRAVLLVAGVRCALQLFCAVLMAGRVRRARTQRNRIHGIYAEQRAGPLIEHGAAAVRAAGYGRVGTRHRVVYDRRDAREDEFRVDAHFSAAQRHCRWGNRQRPDARGAVVVLSRPDVAGAFRAERICESAQLPAQWRVVDRKRVATAH